MDDLMLLLEAEFVLILAEIDIRMEHLTSLIGDDDGRFEDRNA